ncbi:MarR family winged helix-turn-helix transcriptional regulator [Puerhibacterium sp. TATVAM-FAB25]|uniref:MarR family winged helix-turn-helix transcriptional regulator n=1 Tax=Puerhibacterium sp. TATVAM-FAB25 TaxID=3093699 RepID=UPI0039792D9E
MQPDRPARSRYDTTADATAEAMADLVDLVVNVAREVRHHGARDAAVVRLTSAEGNVMRYVDRHPGASAGEVAEATGLQRSNLSTALRGLQASGLIERRADDADGRAVHVYPTPKAAENLRRLRREWAERVEAALGGETAHLEGAVALLRALEEGLVAARRRG